MPKQNRRSSNIRMYITWLALGLVVAGVILGAWQVLPLNRIADREVSAELVITGLPEGLTITPPDVKFVGARVKGPLSLVEALAAKQLTCTLDLAGRTPGLVSIPLAADHFGLSEALRITAIKPETITLRIQTAARKKLPVYIALAGQPATGFKVMDAFALPGHVTVAGPQNLLAGMDRLMTKPITIEGVAESMRKETALNLPAGVHPTDMAKAIIADIRIAAKTDHRTFSRIRVMARETEHTAVFSPPEITLEIKGPADTLAKLNRDRDMTAYVDLANLKPGVYVKRASISLPVSITLLKAKPELFTVTLTEKRPSAEK